MALKETPVHFSALEKRSPLSPPRLVRKRRRGGFTNTLTQTVNSATDRRGRSVLRYRIEGVDAKTGKAAPPIEVDAPDERDAATLAKIQGVLATRITTITELLTVVKESEPGTGGPQTKRTTLISIEGRPLWFAATLGVGLLIAAMWFVLPSLQSDDHPATTLQRPVDPVISASVDDRSREFHIMILKSMGNSMYLDRYVDSSGLRLTLDDYWGYIFGGVSHIHAPDSEPYEMEWRLQSGLMFPDTNVPVSFLDVSYEGPFSHEVAVAAVKEFYRIGGGGIAIEDVQKAMQEAESLFLDVRSREASEYGLAWQVESRVPETISISGPVGDYLIKVRIFEWPVEPYIRETERCKIFIFFAFCPPGLTEVKSIHASGF